MRAAAIDDAMRRAGGAAARVVGEPYVLHRPDGAAGPLRSATARIRLPALFMPLHASVPSHGHLIFEGVFDSAYVRVGDYLVGAAATYFVLGRQPLQPVLCARAVRTAGFARAPAQLAASSGGYGGVVRGATQSVLSGWPVAVVEAGEGIARGGLPADVPVGGWSVLLPEVPGVVLQPGDLMTDDLGRAGVVASAGLSEHGWRLLVRQAAT